MALPVKRWCSEHLPATLAGQVLGASTVVRTHGRVVDPEQRPQRLPMRLMAPDLSQVAAEILGGPDGPSTLWARLAHRLLLAPRYYRSPYSRKPRSAQRK